MSWASTAPAAMVALARVLGQIPLDGEVRDGPAVGDSSAREVITVGYIGPDDDSSAENTASPGGLGGLRDRENYDVHCAVAVSAGDEDVGSARTRCFALFAACGQQIYNDPTLGRVVMNSQISSWALREDMTTGGMFVRVRFDVSIDAFTASA